MMRLDNDARDRGLLSDATPYSSLETSGRNSEFDVPMATTRRTGKQRSCYVCLALIVVAAIVSASVVGVKNSRGAGNDDSSTLNLRHEHEPLAPAPSPAHPVPQGPPGRSPASAAPPPLAVAPAPLNAFAPTASIPGDVLFNDICYQTINPDVCLNIFASNPNAHKVDLQQWTIIAMEAAETAVNESYRLAMNMKNANIGNDALLQCLSVFSDALDQLNTSMYLVADMNLHHPGTTGADVQTYMSAAMTDQDTCQEGIGEVGGWPGSDLISGARAEHVNTVLSIALTFVNSLTTSMTDPNHHRRLLHIEPHFRGGSILGRRGLLSHQ